MKHIYACCKTPCISPCIYIDDDKHVPRDVKLIVRLVVSCSVKSITVQAPLLLLLLLLLPSLGQY